MFSHFGSSSSLSAQLKALETPGEGSGCDTQVNVFFSPGTGASLVISPIQLTFEPQSTTLKSLFSHPSYLGHLRRNATPLAPSAGLRVLLSLTPFPTPTRDYLLSSPGQTWVEDTSGSLSFSLAR